MLTVKGIVAVLDYAKSKGWTGEYGGEDDTWEDLVFAFWEAISWLGVKRDVAFFPDITVDRG